MKSHEELSSSNCMLAPSRRHNLPPAAPDSGLPPEVRRPPEAAAGGGHLTQLGERAVKSCVWCGAEFEPRNNGGSAQRFCSKDCRQNFNTACRIWAGAEFEAERVSIDQLRTCLGQRACCVQRDSASERGKAPRNRDEPCPASRGSGTPVTLAAKICRHIDRPICNRSRKPCPS